MNTKDNIELLPEDRVQLTGDQKNLIALALEKQLPFEDAEFLEKVQKKAGVESYKKIHTHFVKHYGNEFGEILLAAITNGEEGCNAAINDIEIARAQDRIRKDSRN